MGRQAYPQNLALVNCHLIPESWCCCPHKLQLIINKPLRLISQHSTRVKQAMPFEMVLQAVILSTKDKVLNYYAAHATRKCHNTCHKHAIFIGDECKPLQCSAQYCQQEYGRRAMQITSIRIMIMCVKHMCIISMSGVYVWIKTQ